MDISSESENSQVGTSIILEREEKISIKKTTNIYVERKQTRVRQLYNSTARNHTNRIGSNKVKTELLPSVNNQSKKPTSSRAKRLQRTNFQLQALNQRIEDEIVKLEKYREHLLTSKKKKHSQSRHVETNNQREQEMTWRESLAANKLNSKCDNNTFDSCTQILNSIFAANNDDIGIRPRIRAVGLQEIQNSRNTVTYNCVRLEQKLQQTNNAAIEQQEVHAQTERASAGCTFGHDNQMQCSVYQCDYAGNANCYNYQQHTCPHCSSQSYGSGYCQQPATAYQYCVTPTVCMSSPPPTSPHCNLALCCCPPATRRCGTDLNTEDFCRNRAIEEQIGRSRSSSASKRKDTPRSSINRAKSKSKSQTRSQKSKTEERANKLLPEGLSDITSLHKYRVQNKEKLIKVTLKRASETSAITSDNVSSIEGMRITEYTSAAAMQAENDSQNAADMPKTEEEKRQMYQEYLEQYRAETIAKDTKAQEESRAAVAMAPSPVSNGILSAEHSIENTVVQETGNVELRSDKTYSKIPYPEATQNITPNDDDMPHVYEVEPISQLGGVSLHTTAENIDPTAATEQTQGDQSSWKQQQVNGQVFPTGYADSYREQPQTTSQQQQAYSQEQLQTTGQQQHPQITSQQQHQAYSQLQPQTSNQQQQQAYSQLQPQTSSQQQPQTRSQQQPEIYNEEQQQTSSHEQQQTRSQQQPQTRRQQQPEIYNEEQQQPEIYNGKQQQTYSQQQPQTRRQQPQTYSQEHPQTTSQQQQQTYSQEPPQIYNQQQPQIYSQEQQQIASRQQQPTSQQHQITGHISSVTYIKQLTKIKQVERPTQTDYDQQPLQITYCRAGFPREFYEERLEEFCNVQCPLESQTNYVDNQRPPRDQFSQLRQPTLSIQPSHEKRPSYSKPPRYEGQLDDIRHLDQSDAEQRQSYEGQSRNRYEESRNQVRYEEEPQQSFSNRSSGYENRRFAMKPDDWDAIPIANGRVDTRREGSHMKYYPEQPEDSQQMRTTQPSYDSYSQPHRTTTVPQGRQLSPGYDDEVNQPRSLEPTSSPHHQQALEIPQTQPHNRPPAYNETSTQNSNYYPIENPPHKRLVNLPQEECCSITSICKSYEQVVCTTTRRSMPCENRSMNGNEGQTYRNSIDRQQPLTLTEIRTISPPAVDQELNDLSISRPLGNAPTAASTAYAPNNRNLEQNGQPITQIGHEIGSEVPTFQPKSAEVQEQPMLPSKSIAAFHVQSESVRSVQNGNGHTMAKPITSEASTSTLETAAQTTNVPEADVQRTPLSATPVPFQTKPVETQSEQTQYERQRNVDFSLPPVRSVSNNQTAAQDTPQYAASSPSQYTMNQTAAQATSQYAASSPSQYTMNQRQRSNQRYQRRQPMETEFRRYRSPSADERIRSQPAYRYNAVSDENDEMTYSSSSPSTPATVYRRNGRGRPMARQRIEQMSPNRRPPPGYGKDCEIVRSTETVVLRRSPIDWERCRRNSHMPKRRDEYAWNARDARPTSDYGSTEDDFVSTCRTFGSCSTLQTCMDSDYGDYMTCDESQGDDNNFRQLPKFKACSCMYDTYLNMAALCAPRPHQQAPNPKNPRIQDTRYARQHHSSY